MHLRNAWYHSQGKIPNTKIKKNCETLLICREFPSDYKAIFFAAQIHSKGVHILTPEDSIIFRF